MKPEQSSGEHHKPKEDATLTRRDFLQKMSAAVLGTEALINSAVDSEAAVQAGDMKYRMLGKTGISVSAIGFGSHVNAQNRNNPATRMAQIHKGLEQGINLFDIYDHSYHQFDLMSEVLGPVRQDVVISLVSVGPASQVMQEIEVALNTFRIVDLTTFPFRGVDS